MWRGTLAPRRVLNLVEHLPADSALRLALAPHSYGWDRHAHMTADLFDAVAFVSWTVAQANSDKRVKHPQPYPRPQTLRRRPPLDLSKHPLAQPLPEKYRTTTE